MRSLIKSQTEQGDNLELWHSSSLQEDEPRDHVVDESYVTIDLNSQFTTSSYVYLTGPNQSDRASKKGYNFNYNHSWILTQCLITEETAPTQTAQLI